uniref:Glutathione S-transferase omega-like 2 n=1 Tax=Lygus hesperus TaxID=30085 RepID=A0A0A9XYS2_LYGHE
MTLLSGPKKMAIREALMAERAARAASPDFPRIHENPYFREDVKESSIDSLEHSVGCPKYKCTSKSKCQLRSPARSPTPRVLHPKPWGARDPKEIPCTCFTRRKYQKSAPSSIRNSPTRELRKSIPRRAQSPRSSILKDETPDDVSEVMKMFEEFCDHAERKGVKLSPSTLDSMFSKMRSKLCNTTLNSTAKTKTQASGRLGKRQTSSADSTKQVHDVLLHDRKPLPEVPQDHRSQSNQSHQPSMSSSTVRGKLEANNVILELSGSDFPDQSATFTNIFGSMLPSDRFNYVALGGNQFFGPGEVLSTGIPTATILIDSTEAYMPTDVVMPARLPRSLARGRRKP